MVESKEKSIAEFIPRGPRGKTTGLSFEMLEK